MSGGTQEPPKSARVVSSDPMERIATAFERMADAMDRHVGGLPKIVRQDSGGTQEPTK
jgi:hypothetical protein